MDDDQAVAGSQQTPANAAGASAASASQPQVFGRVKCRMCKEHQRLHDEIEREARLHGKDLKTLDADDKKKLLKAFKAYKASGWKRGYKSKK